jgi:hypothetical protein
VEAAVSEPDNEEASTAAIQDLEKQFGPDHPLVEFAHQHPEALVRPAKTAANPIAQRILVPPGGKILSRPTPPPPGPPPPPPPPPPRSVHSSTFDASLMGYAKNTAKPYGFTYTLYKVNSPGDAPTHVISNSLGDYAPGPPAKSMTIHAIKDLSSVSKTITGLSMMKLISLVPEVASGLKAVKAATGAQATAAAAAWKALVDKYYNLPITGLLPPDSVGGTAWDAIRAADGHYPAKDIRISDLLSHTSGLGFDEHGNAIQVPPGSKDYIDGDDMAAIETCLKHWTRAAYDHAQVATTLQYANSNFAIMRYIIPSFNQKYSQPQSWDPPQSYNLDLLYALYTQMNLFPTSVFTSSSTPQVAAWGHGRVWWSDITHKTVYDYSDDEFTDWYPVAGAQGWKMSVRQLGYFMSCVISGRIFPIDYWTYLVNRINSVGYSAGISSQGGTAGSGITYFTHNGGDETDISTSNGGVAKVRSSTWWCNFDNYILAMFCNSDITGDDYVWDWFTAADAALKLAYT